MKNEEILNAIDDVKRIFRITGNKYNDFDQEKGFDRLYKMCASMCKHLFGNDILIEKYSYLRIENKKKITITKYYLNKNYLNDLEFKCDNNPKPLT